MYLMGTSLSHYGLITLVRIPYLFDSISHDVPYDNHLLLLAKTDRPPNRLSFHSGIPLRFHDVDPARGSEVQATEL